MQQCANCRSTDLNIRENKNKKGQTVITYRCKKCKQRFTRNKKEQP